MEKRIQDVCPTPVSHWTGENQTPVLDIVKRLCRCGRRECLIPSDMDGGLNTDNVVADRRQRGKSAPNVSSSSFWVVMKHTGEGVHADHLLSGELRLVGLR